MDNTEEIYKKLREMRRSRGLTVNKLAERMGENHQKVGRIERGKRSLTLDYLVKAAKALEMPVETLIQKTHSNHSETATHVHGPALLDTIVVKIEEKKEDLPFELSPQKKGKLISKLFEQALQFPQQIQALFIDSFLESLCSVDKS